MLRHLPSYEARVLGQNAEPSLPLATKISYASSQLSKPESADPVHQQLQLHHNHHYQRQFVSSNLPGYQAPQATFLWQPSPYRGHSDPGEAKGVTKTSAGGGLYSDFVEGSALAGAGPGAIGNYKDTEGLRIAPGTNLVSPVKHNRLGVKRECLSPELVTPK